MADIEWLTDVEENISRWRMLHENGDAWTRDEEHTAAMMLLEEGPKLIELVTLAERRLEEVLLAGCIMRSIHKLDDLHSRLRSGEVGQK